MGTRRERSTKRREGGRFSSHDKELQVTTHSFCSPYDVSMVLAIACFWIGVGTFIPRLCSPLMRGAGTPNHTHSSIPDMPSLLETTKSASVVEASVNEVMFSVEGVFAIVGIASLTTCRKESVKTYPGTLPIQRYMVIGMIFCVQGFIQDISKRRGTHLSPPTLPHPKKL